MSSACKSVMETATKAFVACSAIPQLSSVRLRGQENPAWDVMSIQAVWSSASPVAGAKRSHTTNDVIAINEGTFAGRIFTSDPSVHSIEDASCIRAFSTDMNKQVVIFKNSKGDFILELWDDLEGLEKSVSLTDLDAHGDVYLDDSLGCLAVAPSDGGKCAVVYVAEEKKPKTSSFTKGFGAEFKPPAADGGNDDELRGREFDYVEDWGEQLVGKSQTVVVRLDLDTGKATVFSRESFGVEKDNPNVHKVLPDDFCVGKLVFGASADVVYGQAVTTAKRRLGFVYCDNRPAHIFKLDMSDGGKYSVLSNDSDQISARQPKFSQESATLLWLERDLGLDSIYPGSHANCVRVMKKKADGPPEILVDVVKEFEPETDTFAGIYPVNAWPKHQFSVGDSHVAINSVVGSKPVSVLVNLKTGKHTVLGTHKIVHDVKQVGPDAFVMAGETHDCLTQPQIFITTVQISNDEVEVTSTRSWPAVRPKSIIFFQVSEVISRSGTGPILPATAARSSSDPFMSGPRTLPSRGVCHSLSGYTAGRSQSSRTASMPKSSTSWLLVMLS